MLTGLIAVVVPDFGQFLNLVGSFSGTVLVFILPVIFYHKIMEGKVAMKQKILNYCVLATGTLFGVLGTYTSLKELIYQGEIKNL